MAPTIIESKVYDPAREDGDLDRPVRLHLNVQGMPEEPTHVTLNVGPFSVTHYSKYMKIFCDEASWDDEDTVACAVKFNNHFATAEWEPVVPVMVLDMDREMPGKLGKRLPFYSDYYCKVSDVTAMLRYIERHQYEAEPLPTWRIYPSIASALVKEHAWEIIDADELCVKCNDFGVQVNVGKRLVPMCFEHRRAWNDINQLHRLASN